MQTRSRDGSPGSGVKLPQVHTNSMGQSNIIYPYSSLHMKFPLASPQDLRLSAPGISYRISMYL